MIDSRYRTSAGCGFTLQYHLVWCPKDRLRILTDEVAERLKEVLDETAKGNNSVIEALEVMADQVHMFVSADPTEAPQSIANPFTGYTSRILRTEFTHLCSRMPTLWSRSDDVGSIGQVSEETVQKDLEAQETRS
jgi:putative transposase